jgi:hypothetical protein
LALGGEADNVKLDAPAMVSEVGEFAVCPPTVSMNTPEAAPAGITKEAVVALNVEMGALIVPPLCAASAI